MSSGDVKGRRERERRPIRRRERFSRSVLVAVTGGIIVIAALAASGGPLLTSRHVAPATLHPSGESIGATRPSSAPRRFGSGVVSPAQHDLTLIAAVLVGIAFTIAILVGVRFLIGLMKDLDVVPLEPGDDPATRLAQAEGETSQRDLVGELDKALEDLDEDRDPRSAVIGCWVRLEQVASERAVGRRPFETSGELVRRILGAFDVDASGLDRLHGLYRQARYSSAVVGETQRDEARRILLVLRDRLPVASVGAGTSAEAGG
jgi:Domain of unknown function (DUF4129)